MPTPKQGESRSAFVSRCIPYVQREDTSLSDKQAAGKCHGLWKQHRKATAMTDINVIRKIGVEPIKATGNDGRYRAYVVRFSDPEHLDLEGNYFTKDTLFHLDWYKTRPWLYHHGLNPDMGAIKIGEWDTAGVDETGVFFEGELLQHFKYRDAVTVLLDEYKCLFPSTGAIGYLVKATEDGWLAEWPIVEASSTVTPAEFRLGPIEPKAVAAVKSLQGGLTMSGTLGKMGEALDHLLGRKDTGELEHEEEQGAATPSENEEPQEDQEPGAPEDTETPEETEASDTPMAEVPARSAEIIELVTNQQKLVEAVVRMDAIIAEQDKELKALRETVTALKASTTEQLKAAMTGKDWFESLYLNSRDGTVKSADEPAARPSVGQSGSEGESSPYLQIRQAQALE